MATHSPDFSDDEFEFVEEYFSRTYQPLSNLPTPPPSSHESLANQSPEALLEDGGLLDSALLGPAIHLVNLIPPAASLTAPSVPVVHEMLVRADLPMDIIALAVCVLDSLSSKFSLNWRLLCPLAQREPTNEVTKRHTIQASPAAATQLHIDSVSPEVIVLGALVIAFKFVVDCQEPTRYYRDVWGRNMWTSDQINVTERCILENLGCRILPLWDSVLIADATRDMQRAARQAAFASHPRNGEAHKRSVSSGEVLSVRIPLTPAETPTLENGPTVSPVREAADTAFYGGDLASVDSSTLKLPPRTKRKASSPVSG
ncbi:hypothetical protein N657DRAFT_679186 [Parathielavia appendiculata]|uniref:Cyclin-like domain-containing protein n=1 Tax=Parathielavia appendiculata TaxID=2587402 RepID=A0AAN6U4C7_9PEZI|nr:hypothetical protein N657DRAFT_679186 [Parathielavia appendiculata]